MGYMMFRPLVRLSSFKGDFVPTKAERSAKIRLGVFCFTADRKRNGRYGEGRAA